MAETGKLKEIATELIDYFQQVGWCMDLDTKKKIIDALRDAYDAGMIDAYDAAGDYDY